MSTKKKLAMPVILLLFLLSVFHCQTSAQIIRTFGFFKTSSTSKPNDGYAQIFACQIGQQTSQITLALQLQQTPYAGTETVAPNALYSKTIPQAELISSRNVGVTMSQLGLQLDTPSDQIAVYAAGSAQGSIDGFQLAPVSDDSTKFFIAGLEGVSGLPDTGLVLATKEGDTEAEIFQFVNNAYVSIFNVSFSDSFSVAQVVFQTDTTGIKVESTRPISVYLQVVCGAPTSVNFCGHLAEQIPPVAELGQTYVVPPIGGRSSGAGYVVRVVSTEASTTIITTSSSTLSPPAGTFSKSAGEFLEINVADTSKPVVVTCDKRCLVMQYNKGARAEPQGATAILTGPFMMRTTPLIKFGNATCFSTALATDTNSSTGEILLRPTKNFISVVTMISYKSSIVLDGIVLSGTWTDEPPYSVLTQTVSHGYHSITVVLGSGATFAAYVYGYKTISGGPNGFYGYGFSAATEILVKEAAVSTTETLPVTSTAEVVTSAVNATLPELTSVQRITVGLSSVGISVFFFIILFFVITL